MESLSIVKPLERPLVVFSSSIDSAREVVLVGLRWLTPHWCDLVIGWLEQGLAVDDEIDAALREILPNRELPQSLRHRSFELHIRFAKKRVVE